MVHDEKKAAEQLDALLTESERPAPVMTKEGQDAVQRAAEQVRDDQRNWNKP